MKICSKCKHYRDRDCLAKAEKETDIVTGRTYLIKKEPAAWNRTESGACGPDAKLYIKGSPVGNLLNTYDAVELIMYVAVFMAAAIVVTGLFLK